MITCQAIYKALCEASTASAVADNVPDVMHHLHWVVKDVAGRKGPLREALRSGPVCSDFPCLSPVPCVVKDPFECRTTH
jgi:hypothetical protein